MMDTEKQECCDNKEECIVCCKTVLRDKLEPIHKKHPDILICVECFLRLFKVERIAYYSRSNPDVNPESHGANNLVNTDIIDCINESHILCPYCRERISGSEFPNHIERITKDTKYISATCYPSEWKYWRKDIEKYKQWYKAEQKSVLSLAKELSLKETTIEELSRELDRYYNLYIKVSKLANCLKLKMIRIQKTHQFEETSNTTENVTPGNDRNAVGPVGLGDHDGQGSTPEQSDRQEIQ